MPAPLPIQPVIELSLGGVWTDVSTYVDCVAAPPSITRGRQDEQSRLAASTMTLRLNNYDGRFSPRNPTGAYYGLIGRNTPCRISLPTYGYRHYGEISNWPTTWDHGGRDAWTSVTSSGITRRLSQGAPPLAGAFERYVAGLSTAAAYWPLTDPQGSTTMASGLADGQVMLVEGASQPRLAASTDFPSSDPLPILNSGSFRGGVNTYSGGTYFQFLLSVPAAGDTNDAVLVRLLTGGTVYRWELRYFTATGLVLRAFDSLGASLLTSAATGSVNGMKLVVRFGFIQSGGNISWFVQYFDYVTGASVASISGAFAGTNGAVNQVQFSADRVLTNTVVGQALLSTVDLNPDFQNAYRGYAGETAGRRIQRLCAAEGVPLVTVGDLDATELMGPQTAQPLLDLLAECEAEDMGYLYEPRDALALAYRTRESLYLQAIQATVPYTAVQDLEPVEDDQRTRNDVTVTRTGGSSARAVQSTGALSVLAPPNGVGRYQTGVTLNAYTDARLLALAQWLLALGTIDEPRYPTIGIDPTAYAAGLKSDVAGIDVGDLVVLTGTPKWVPPGGIRALAIGYTERLAQHSWKLEMNCIPATPYDDAFKLNDSTYGRLDSDSSVTSGALTTTTTTVPYAGGDWITTAGYPSEFPFDITIGGETMRVTAAVAGSLTVTRSINGVVKSHLTGQPIRLAQPNRIVL